MAHQRILFGAVLTAVVIFAATWAQARAAVETTPVPLRRAYLCFNGNSAGEVMKKANEAGARGWRMISAAPGRSGAVWCFEQLAASRPNGDSIQ